MAPGALQMDLGGRSAALGSTALMAVAAATHFENDFFMNDLGQPGVVSPDTPPQRRVTVTRRGPYRATGVRVDRRDGSAAPSVVDQNRSCDPPPPKRVFTMLL